MEREEARQGIEGYHPFNVIGNIGGEGLNLSQLGTDLKATRIQLAKERFKRSRGNILRKNRKRQDGSRSH